jgi:hypothetical protein
VILKGMLRSFGCQAPICLTLIPRLTERIAHRRQKFFVIERLHEEICASWVHLHSTSSMSLGRQIFEFNGLIREQATRSRRLRLSLVPRCAQE